MVAGVTSSAAACIKYYIDVHTLFVLNYFVYVVSVRNTLHLHGESSLQNLL